MSPRATLPVALRVDWTARRIATLSLIAAAGLAVALAPVAAPQLLKSGFAIVLVTVALFATGALPSLITALLFFSLALATGAAPPLQLAAGFWSNGALLIFGGLIIGAAAERSGLGRYIARGLMQRFVDSYLHLLFGILVGTLALSFIVPSTMGRLAITIPIVTAIAEEAGYAPGTNGYAGTVLTAVIGNFTTSFAILPANLVNVIVLGAGEGLFGPQLRYAEYLLLCGPVLGCVKGATFLVLAALLFPAPPPARPTDTAPLPLSNAARRLGAVLAVTVALWATDSMHGLKPGWIAIGAGILCLLPPIALVGLRESFDLNRLTAVIAVPAVLGVAAVLTHSGAGRVIAGTMTDVVPLAGQSAAVGFSAIALMSSLVALIATIVGSIAIVTPLLADVGHATGLPVKLGLVAEVAGLQAVFFHYEAVPVMVGLAMGRIAPSKAVRLLIPLAIVGLAVILPLEVGWLKLLGALP